MHIMCVHIPQQLKDRHKLKQLLRHCINIDSCHSPQSIDLPSHTRKGIQRNNPFQF